MTMVAVILLSKIIFFLTRYFNFAIVCLSITKYEYSFLVLSFCYPVNFPFFWKVFWYKFEWFLKDNMDFNLSRWHKNVPKSGFIAFLGFNFYLIFIYLYLSLLPLVISSITLKRRMLFFNISIYIFSFRFSWSNYNGYTEPLTLWSLFLLDTVKFELELHILT